MRAILWDMDGTLLDSEPAHDAAFARAMEALGLTVGPGFSEGLLGASGDLVHAALVRETGTSVTLSEWEAAKAAAFRQVLPMIRRLPAAELVALPVAQAVVSNSTAEEVQTCLAACGLRFDVALSRQDVARGKPDPEGYLKAARLLGVQPGDCVVVEDSPRGAEAGLAAGATVVFHPQGETRGPEGAIHLQPGGDLGALLRDLLALR